MVRNIGDYLSNGRKEVQTLGPNHPEVKVGNGLFQKKTEKSSEGANPINPYRRVNESRPYRRRPLPLTWGNHSKSLTVQKTKNLEFVRRRHQGPVKGRVGDRG